MSAYLTIDVGTSSAKVALFRADGSPWLGRGSAYPIQYPQAGWAEQDPRLWWQAAGELSRAVLAEAGRPRVRAVCVSGQAPLCVPVDRSGTPLRPAILWLDRRAQPQADWLRERMGLETAARISGNTLDPYYGGVKWLWFRQAEPELYRQTWKILQAHGYINYQLTGEAATDPSHAGMCSPCFNLRERAWDEGACQLMEIDLAKLPAIRPSAEVIGAVTRAAAQATGIPEGTPVVCGGGDFACACLGAGVSGEGSAAMMLGTAGNLLVPGLERADPRLINTVHLTGEGLSLGGVLAGEAAGWFREMLNLPQEGLIETLEREAAQAPAGADGLVFLPYLLGERTPVWDSRARGVFFGLAASHRRGVLYRAVLEGVAYAFRQMGEILAECGRPLREVVAINGGARSPLWRQIMADVLGVPVHWRPTSGGTALGAAWLAALGAGDVKGFAGLSAWLEPAVDTLPDAETRAVYAARYAVYRQLYDRVKDLF